MKKALAIIGSVATVGIIGGALSNDPEPTIEPAITPKVAEEVITPELVVEPTPTPTPMAPTSVVVPTQNTTPPKSQSNCSPHYSGCVPIASDVDCAGGPGNGPAYVRGPVQVIGSDIYGLDRDGDGLGCE